MKTAGVSQAIAMALAGIPALYFQSLVGTHNDQEGVEAIPGSRLAIIPGVGHYPHVEDPAAVERVLLDFMTSTEPGYIGHEALGKLVSAGAPQR